MLTYSHRNRAEGGARRTCKRRRGLSQIGSRTVDQRLIFLGAHWASSAGPGFESQGCNPPCSSLKRLRTFIRALPKRFSPQSSRRPSACSRLKPMPQIRSYGEACSRNGQPRVLQEGRVWAPPQPAPCPPSRAADLVADSVPCRW